jgi:hypothetical protein
MINKIPGSRIFLNAFMGFYINFDRLQFYYFHDQNFTEYSTILLYAVYALKETQGNIVQDFF